MIPPELEAEILRLHHAEKWPVGTIARQLGVHHSTVKRVLAQAGLPAGRRSARPTLADPFIPFIVETLEKYPRLCASRLYAMVKERGYAGGPDHFRSVVARYRPRRPAEAFLRLRTLPGEEAQVDWGHFGTLQIGRAERRLVGFVCVLSYSRHLFLRYYLGNDMPHFLRGHVDAFTFFDGVARTIKYDNLKSAVLERRLDAIRFHPTLLELAAHYRFEPRPVAVARGNEKGRVERAIRFVRTSFFAARSFRDLDDLNRQAHDWCLSTAAERSWPEDRSRKVGEVFEEEKPRLMKLPPDSFPCEERVSVKVPKSPYVRFDRNDYSVPHAHVRQTLVVVASLDTVRIVAGNQVVATHARSWDKGRQIEDPRHIEALVAHKRQAREHRGIDRLAHAAPSSQRLFEEVALRGGSLGGTTSQLLKLLDRYGPHELERAIAEALKHDAPHLGAVRQILDRNRFAAGKPPPVPVRVPDDPRLRDLVVRPHSLTGYDRLSEEDDEPDPARS
jgi:transposase